MIRAGDTVKHRPSGETWDVSATRDQDLIPAGWPESIAIIIDCELLTAADDEQHLKMLLEVLSSKGNGLRYVWARSNFIEALRHHDRQTLNILFNRANLAESEAREYRVNAESMFRRLVTQYQREADE